ncbi:ABC transporter permease [Allonocardiopsis opalescens]|uniref:ABC-type nitrate/sulfonate/bicarbonate transport system permease component n=1 Tax=Allonocardiopsis opalescens TaxID=1144618 RepID=A0A2T0Q7N2_9ACTN|nr:ABC transporter permease subunit [Allonocardiopsis opalescens]PRX99837.1 ABC-type nitrate/sulfonate/bicarbonate transport system permease component [Allonocardiopsis opalescens]
MSRGGGAAARLGRRALRVCALPAGLVALWWAAAASSRSYYLPAPDAVAVTFAEVWFSERILADALPSVVRLLAGFALAAVLGVALGTAIGSSPRLRAFTEPVLEFWRAVPPPVLVPLLILLAGIDDAMKVLVIVSGCVWPILLNTVEGVRAVDPVLADTCRSYRISGFTRLRTLVLRSASPQIMAGLRQALSIAIILMVISEMFASSSGLGFTIVQFQRGFAIPEMWSGIVLLGLLGLALSLAFQRVERSVLDWYHGLRAATRGE